MSQSKRDAALFEAKRLTDVMSRVPVDLNRATRPSKAPAVIEAAAKCGACTHTEACDAWIAGHEEGDGHDAPDFCPNRQLLHSFPPVID